MTESTAITVSLGNFADFVTARSSRRIGVVRNVIDIYADDYAPSRDFYKPIRDALIAGVSNGDDIERMQRTTAETVNGN